MFMKSGRSRHESQAIAGRIGKVRNAELHDFTDKADAP